MWKQTSVCVCAWKKITIVTSTVLLSWLLSLLSTVLRLGMQLINGWKGEIRYEEGAATGLHNDVSGNGKGFWGMMDGMIERASFFLCTQYRITAWDSQGEGKVTPGPGERIRVMNVAWCCIFDTVSGLGCGVGTLMGRRSVAVLGLTRLKIEQVVVTIPMFIHRSLMVRG